MDEKILYILLGLAYLAFQYFGSLKKKQAEAEKKHPPPPRRDGTPDQEPTATSEEPPMLTLEDILQRAADESRKAKEARRAAQQQRQLEPQRRQPAQPRRQPVEPQRTWVAEKPKPAPRKQASPFLNTDSAGYRAPQMEAYSTLEGASLETFGEEGGVSISDVHNPILTFETDEQRPSINLRQAMLHQVILQRPEY